VVFSGEYAGVPKVTTNLKGNSISPIFVNWLVADQSAKGFRILISQPQSSDLSFDWIALAVNNMPPVIEQVKSSSDSVTLNTPVQFSAVVSDPDNNGSDLKYTWSLSPAIGVLSDSNTPISSLLVNNISSDTDVTVTLTVSDGVNSVSSTQTVKVLSGNNPPLVENPPITNETSTPPLVITDILGCTDKTAVNYDPSATKDNNSCTYPVISQNPTSTSPVAEGETGGVVTGATVP
jgi:hypothetical protein